MILVLGSIKLLGTMVINTIVVALATTFALCALILYKMDMPIYFKGDTRVPLHTIKFGTKEIIFSSPRVDNATMCIQWQV